MRFVTPFVVAVLDVGSLLFSAIGCLLFLFNVTRGIDDTAVIDFVEEEVNDDNEEEEEDEDEEVLLPDVVFVLLLASNAILAARNSATSSNSCFSC